MTWKIAIRALAILAVLVSTPRLLRAAEFNFQLVEWLRDWRGSPGGQARKPAFERRDRGQFFEGVRALNEGKHHAAVERLAPYVARHPEERPAALFLGMAYRGTGSEEQALQVWRKADAAQYFLNRGRHSRASGDIDTAIRLGAAGPTSYYLLGDVLDEAGKTGASVEAYRAGLSLDRGNSYEQYVVRGKLLERVGDWREAVAAYEAAIKVRPAVAEAYLSAANVYRQRMNDSQSALRIYSRCALRTQDIWCHLQGFAVAMELKRVDEATRFAIEAEARYRSSPFPRVARAEIAELSGDTNRAAEFYRQAGALAPEWYLPWYRLGRLAMDDGSAAEAVMHFRRAVQLQPDDANAKEGLARALSASQKVVNR